MPRPELSQSIASTPGRPDTPVAAYRLQPMYAQIQACVSHSDRYLREGGGGEGGGGERKYGELGGLVGPKFQA